MRGARAFLITVLATLLLSSGLGRATTAGPASACAGSFSGGQSSCMFEYVGVRVMPWAVAPASVSIVVEARLVRPDGRHTTLATCMAGVGYPVCLGQVVSIPERPAGQQLQCFIRGTGKAAYGCVSQEPVL